MIILGIESSCDETAAALVNENREVLASKVLSQIDEHKKFGGVVPEIAARSHLEYIDVIIDDVMKEAGIDYSDLCAVAGASGPGLIGGVIVGVMAAKSIALAKKIPFIAVNHLEGHALTARLTSDVKYPYLLLLVSGGHCQILAVEGVGKFTRLGTTIDDAAGEAFDKVSKMLSLGYPGGPIVEEKAKKGDEKAYKFPRPLRGQKGCDMSFSGLKTAVRHQIEKLSPDGTLENANLSEKQICDICASFQLAVCDSLTGRLSKAIEIYKEKHKDGDSLVVAGGVAANGFLRDALQKLADKNQMKFFAPPLKLCTDNAQMIAWAGLENYIAGNHAGLDFKPRPRWALDENAPKARGAGGVKA